MDTFRLPLEHFSETGSLSKLLDHRSEFHSNGCDGSASSRKALFIGSELDRAQLGLLLIGLIPVSVAVGGAVGVATKSVSAGAEVAGALVAVVTLVFGYIGWYSSSGSGS